MVPAKAVLTDNKQGLCAKPDADTLLEVCAKDPNEPLGARDAAILVLLYAVGLRRAEAAGVEISEFKPRDQSPPVQGTGSKHRIA